MNQDNQGPLILLGIAVLLATYFSHWWMMFFAKHKPNLTEGDLIEDNLYNARSAGVAFVTSFVWVTLLYLYGLALLFEKSSLILSRLNLAPSMIRLILWQQWQPSILLYIAATLLYGGGFGLRLWAIKALDRHFTYEVTIKKNHRLISKPPYFWMRHPAYIGYGLMSVAMGLLFCSPFLLSTLVVPTLIFFMFRIPHEERVLAKRFGKDWQEYVSKTWLILP